MVKVIISFVLSFISIFTAFCYDIVIDKVYGKVKSINEERYTLVSKYGEWVKDKLVSKEVIQFNNSGNVIKQMKFDKDGLLSSTLICCYDENGIKTEQQYFKENNNLFSKRIYKYSADGNKIESPLYNSAGVMVSKQVYILDMKLKTETCEYDSNGILQVKWIYGYDQKRNRISENMYDSSGQLTNKWTYTYNNLGDKIEESWYKADGLRNNRKFYTYEYDNTNNWIEKEEGVTVYKFGELAFEPSIMVIRSIVYYQ